MDSLVLHQSVTHILLKCLFSPSLMGFDYLRDIVTKCCRQKVDYQKLISKFYHEVACEDNCCIDKIDKRIRASLKDAYSRRGFFAMNEYFDDRVYSGDFLQPHEAISLLVEMSKVEYQKQIQNYEKYLQKRGNAC